MLISIDAFLNIIEKKEENEDKKGKNSLEKLRQLVMPQTETVENEEKSCLKITRDLWSLLDKPGDHLQVV